jgi:hypothetical protein
VQTIPRGKATQIKAAG